MHIKYKSNKETLHILTQEKEFVKHGSAEESEDRKQNVQLNLILDKYKRIIEHLD